MIQRRPVVTLAALGLALASCSWSITRRPLWIDEAFSLGATNQLVSTIRNTGGTMALYYVLLDGWTAVAGSSALALRSLSVALVLVAILVLSRLVYRLLPPSQAGLTLVVVALMPATLFMAQNARAYALVVVLTVSCWTCLTRAVEADARGDGRSVRLWCLALVPLVVAGELTHGMFLLQVPALVLSVAVHLRHRRRLLVTLVPAVVAGVATLAFLLLAFDAGHVGDWIRPIDRAQIEALATHLLAHRWPLRAGLGVLVGVGAVALLRRPAPDPVSRWKAVAPLWWAFSPAVLLVALSVVRPSLLGRYVSGSIPALGILIAVGLHAVWRTIVPSLSTSGPDTPRRASHTGRWALGALLVVAAISVPILDRIPRAGERFEDWDAVADYIGSHAHPGDGIVFIPIGGEHDNPDILRAPFEAAWTDRPGPRVDLVALSPARPFGEVLRLDDVLGPAELSARMAEHERVWVVLVPTGWTSFLDTLSREPAASRVHRDPTVLEFNGGMQVVLLTQI
jgi:mannosyltransferase